MSPPLTASGEPEHPYHIEDTPDLIVKIFEFGQEHSPARMLAERSSYLNTIDSGIVMRQFRFFKILNTINVPRDNGGEVEASRFKGNEKLELFRDSIWARRNRLMRVLISLLSTHPEERFKFIDNSKDLFDLGEEWLRNRGRPQLFLISVAMSLLMCSMRRQVFLVQIYESVDKEDDRATCCTRMWNAIGCEIQEFLIPLLRFLYKLRIPSVEERILRYVSDDDDSPSARLHQSYWVEEERFATEYVNRL
ncbi:hypothetical protein BJ508DRAFT_418319, partial [Ascobolus immersus RN42]